MSVEPRTDEVRTARLKLTVATTRADLGLNQDRDTLEDARDALTAEVDTYLNNHEYRRRRRAERRSYRALADWADSNKANSNDPSDPINTLPYWLGLAYERIITALGAMESGADVNYKFILRKAEKALSGNVKTPAQRRADEAAKRRKRAADSRERRRKKREQARAIGAPY